MDSGDGSVSKRRTRQESLKCMVEIIEKRNELSQSGNSTNGRKRKKMETSGGDERNVENNGRRKFSRGTSEYFTNQTFVEEVSDDDDSSSEETDPDVDIVEEEEEDSDPDVVIVAEEEVETEPDVVNVVEEEEEEEEEVETEPDVVNVAEEEVDEEDEEEETDPDVVIVVEEEESDPEVVNVADMCRTGDKSKEFTDTTSYSKSEFESSTDALRKNPMKILEESEFLKFIVDSIKNVHDRNEVIPPEEKEHVSVKETLPLVFRFEDEEPLPPEKEEWEKEIEDLFSEMNMCILESHIGFTNPSVSPMQSGRLSDCQMGNHKLKLDEQIGLICSVCSYVHLEMKYIFPNFVQRTQGRYERKCFGESPSVLDVDGFRVPDSSTAEDSPIYGEGTVWDSVPQSAKATMYPHQRGGFEFMWNNIAGDIKIERLREPLSESKGGCIISHPPGTGKTRLTIVFLQSYLKLFPQCRPVVIAPSNLLLNWEAEFQKWAVDIPFHNLNSKNFSLKEDEGTVGVFHCLSGAAKKNPHLIRMVKLKSWAKSTSILGISYDLFRILTGEDGEGYAKELREILLKFPDLLVLEEGHTARNEHSLVWKALKKVETEKRILLSGTPFQNNIKELYNTLSVVSPKFAADLEQKWASLSSSIDKNARALEELRDIISPLVHKCSENVKKVSLPGIRDTVIHLKTTDLQKELLKRVPENPGSFYEQNLMSLISVHPSLVANRKEFSELESQLKERRCWLDPDIGVKMKFVIELIRLCGGWKERVIIFSQLLDPLNLIKEQLNSLFSWTLGREILYMDGKLDVKQRQISINSLNDPKSDVKVLLASTKACSEGISLIGASRVVLLDVLWNPSVEQQAISRAYRNGQTKFVHVYCPVTSKWEVDKIEQQTRKKYHSDVLLSRNEENTSCSVSEDNILESMVKHEGLRHIFEKLSHAPRVVPTTCFNSGSQPSKGSS
ncbi:hypothetical protein MTR67_036846 [Solanum verrucosum]|uniref:SNF2 domain containing protein n=1 Tax=Solanum verrucosum TaxID=315347 RepID=A0AAF0UD42_SOLVR|nr:hypothetical protein MTR67_036846 [Solanum verrucosum]